MCTAVSFSNGKHYFGRNLDLEYSYNETVVITPRKFPFVFRCGKKMDTHFALIGMAYICNNEALYYDATNEKGLSAAGLNFVGNAVYQKPKADDRYVGSFELISWILAQCSTVEEAKEQLKGLVIADIAFSDELPSTPLHWMIADAERSIVLEPTADGVKVYDNPIGVLTNNPPFDYHLFHLAQHMMLTNQPAQNLFSDQFHLEAFSHGMGAMGMPGDLSSPSRLVRAAFVKANAVCKPVETENVSQFFHILGAVEQQRGCVRLGDGLYEITQYSSCCNTAEGIYYYRTYSNSQISAVHMHHADLDSDTLFSYPLMKEQQMFLQN